MRRDRYQHHDVTSSWPKDWEIVVRRRKRGRTLEELLAEVKRLEEATKRMKGEK